MGVDHVQNYCPLLMQQQENIQVEEHSAEWSQVLCQLQLATGQPSVRLLNLYKYPILMDRSSEDTSITALIDTTDLKSQFGNRVIAKTIPLDDLILICGHINLKNYHQQHSKVFHFLICEVVLGSIAPFTEGYQYADSLLIEQSTSEAPFHYNIFLKSYQQYQVKYECSFMVGDEHELQNTSIICSSCGLRTATLYCKDEKKHYCQGCSQNKHISSPMSPVSPISNRSNSKRQMIQVPPRHQIQPVSRSNSLPLCDNHGLRHESFCLYCQKYLCPSCLQQPLHSQNEQHIVKPIEFLYVEKRQTNTRLPVKPRQKLARMLQLSKDKQRKVIENYQAVRKQIVSEFQKGMKELQQQYKERLVLVQSDVIQIQMQIDRIDWTFSFLRSQQELLKPIHYFKLQSRLEEDFKTVKITGYNNSIDVQASIDHYSLIKVGTKQYINSVKSSLSSGKISEERQGSGRKQDFQEMKKTTQKMFTYDPESKPPQKGQLGLLLENSGVHFFKFGSSKK